MSERSGTVSIVAVTPLPAPPVAPDVVEVTPIIEASVGNEVSVGDGATSGPIPENVNASDVPADEATGC